nr:ABC transporter ATP-binding protein [Candidatus Gracilibacteria bacterium]
MKTLIELKDLHKSYYLENGTEIPVLKGVDLSIKENEFVALMGESGSGKSTLLNILGCLHPLTSGTYELEGEDISELKDDEALSYIRNIKIGFIFQQFYLFPRLSAIENVTLPAIYAETSSKERTQKAIELLKRVGLEAKIDSKPGEMSGGQQQRVAIARALINSPDIILADEPTGNLDSVTTEEIIKLLLELKASGKTIIMVTHAHDVAKNADRVIFLKDGKVLSEDYKLT